MSDLSNNSTRILKLRSEIRKHNHLYYDLDSPEISDKQYDSLVIELQTLSPDDPVLVEMGNPTFGTKVSHSTLMGSLDKVHTIEEIMGKFEGKTVCIMPKVDGLSLATKYKSGYFDWAATRGDGKNGELVTPNAARIDSLPLSILMSDVEIRGEVFISKVDFYGVMDQPGYDDREDGYANPRNAAAGAIRQKDPKEVHNRNLKFVAYKIINPQFKTQSEVLDELLIQGFLVVDHWTMHLTKENKHLLEERIEFIRTHSFAYNIDGVVIMLDNLEEFENAGCSSKCPKGAIAYKYETTQVTSIARSINWVANRSGRIVPTLNMDETEIDGTMVSRASLHNYAWVIDRDVAIGDTILFTKANEIIPYVTAVVDRVNERNRDIPDTCPSCGGPIEISYREVKTKHGIVRKPVDLVCRNDNCPAKFIKHIRRILQILGIKGIDEKTLIKMEEAGLLNNVWDILDIDSDTLISKGFGKGESPNWAKSVTNITTTPQCLLATMGIIGWGRRMFEILFKDKHWSPEQWVKFVIEEGDKALVTDLSWITNIEGIGDERLITLRNGINNRWNIAKQVAQRVTLIYPEEVVGGIFEGKSFCATGTLSRKRDEIYADIKALGGEIKSGVSKELNYLITGDATGSKLTKAQKLGINIITEDTLNKMMGK